MNIFIWPFSFLFLLLPFAVYFLIPKKQKDLKTQALKIPFFNQVVKLKKTSSIALKKEKFNLIFLSLAWIFFVIAAARPVWFLNHKTLPIETRNIILALDVSGSMQEQDFVVNNTAVDRLTAVKEVVDNFLSKRVEDNIALVLFADEAYTYAPLSYDKKTLKSLLKEINHGIAGNQTAMGDGLALAVQNAIKVPAESQIVILLSDGEASQGLVGLNEAIKLAKDNQVKVYTIGIGNPENYQQVFGMKMAIPSSLDEQTLSFIAKETGGEYFLAQNTDTLEKIYQQIDKLEKDESAQKNVKPKKELFFIPLALGLIFLFPVLLKRRPE